MFEPILVSLDDYEKGGRNTNFKFKFKLHYYGSKQDPPSFRYYWLELHLASCDVSWVGGTDFKSNNILGSGGRK